MSGHLFDLEPHHVATTTDDWYTPRWIFDAADITFDMDVAAPMDPTYQHSGSTPWVEKWAQHPDGLILVPAVKSSWIGTLLRAAETLTFLTVEFNRPDGTVAPIRWMNILAGRGSAAAAVALVAARDKHARGAYLVAAP